MCSEEEWLWERLCISVHTINIDTLISNTIPGTWGRALHAVTTNNHRKEELKDIGKKKLFTRIWNAQSTRCSFCFRKQDDHWCVNHPYLKLCMQCSRDKSVFITKTDAKKTYFLNHEDEFKDVFCFMAHNRRYFLVADVKHRAVNKYGDEGGFERRYKKYFERSRKMKIAKHIRKVQRTKELGTILRGLGFTRNMLLKRMQNVEEKAKIEFVLMEYMRNTSLSAQCIGQWFNAHAPCPLV